MSTFTIPKNRLFAPSNLGNLGVEHSKEGFFIVSNGKRVKVQTFDLSKELQGISLEALQKVLAHATLTIGRIGNDYKLRLHVQALGGGPLTGAIAYWGTKIVCYGVATGGAIGLVSTAGGAVGAAALKAGAVISKIAASGSAATVGSTVALQAGPTAGGIAGLAATELATSSIAVGTTIGAKGTGVVGAGIAMVASNPPAVIAAATSAATTTIAAVETGATAMGAFFTACPFCP